MVLNLPLPVQIDVSLIVGDTIMHKMLDNEMLSLDLGDGTSLIFWSNELGEIARLSTKKLEELKEIEQNKLTTEITKEV